MNRSHPRRRTATAIARAASRFGERASSWTRRGAPFALGCLSLSFLGSGGCHHPPRLDHRRQAEHNWNQVRARVKHQLAEKRLSAGHADEAERLAQEAITLDPASLDGYVLLARAHLAQARLASAGRDVEAARRAGLESPELSYLEGIIAEQRGDFAAALERHARARRLAPDRLDYLVAEAECLVALDREGEALALVREHATCFDDDETAARLIERIATLFDSIDADAGNGEPARPLPDETTAVPFDGACKKRSLDLLKGKNHAAAERLLFDYLRVQPDDGEAWMLHAQAAVGCRRLDVAVASARRAAERAPGNLDASWFLAAMLWRAGEWDAARDVVEDVLAVAPDHAAAHCLRGELWLLQNRRREAREHFMIALRSDPRHPWARSSLALAGSPDKEETSVEPRNPAVEARKE